MQRGQLLASCPLGAASSSPAASAASATDGGAEATVTLRRPDQFVGYAHGEGGEGGEGGELSVLLRRHGLHIELVVRPGETARHPAGLVDVRLESALSTIVRPLPRLTSIMLCEIPVKR